MSIEASKWARMADVQKSSNKLVLLELAHLVRFDATDWTVFASVEHLARVTHLNRKTVIDALGRLRDLGVIADTGARAGFSRNCPVYRLRPTAVPRVGLPLLDSAAGAASQEACHQRVDEKEAPAHEDATSDLEEIQSLQSTQNVPELSYDGHMDDIERLVPAMIENSMMSLDASRGTASPGQEVGAELAPAFANSAPAAATPPARTRRQEKSKIRRVTATAAGAASRLPADWTLPARWRDWTLRVRPHWDVDRVEAMALTFSAYWRSKPGQAGYAEDWFAAWRLWVFRERGGLSIEKPWHSSWSGIVAKGQELGVRQAANEPNHAFRIRVHEAAGIPVPS
ncbi:MAG: hypothetical protein ACN6O8_09860 [Achromobacter sp.]|uniref:hypothetical protein n=1 Tax=Achromobacter sp. TaxID=134375 RepID=UPI003CFC53F7